MEPWEIDGGTLVFAMKPDFPLLQLIADMSLAKPPIIFHDEIKRNENWQEYKDAVLLPSGQSCPKEGLEPNPTSPESKDSFRITKNTQSTTLMGYFEAIKRGSMF